VTGEQQLVPDKNKMKTEFIYKTYTYTTVYQKVSGLAAWSENCKRCSFLPLGAVVSLFFESF